MAPIGSSITIVLIILLISIKIKLFQHDVYNRNSANTPEQYVNLNLTSPDGQIEEKLPFLTAALYYRPRHNIVIRPRNHRKRRAINTDSNSNTSKQILLQLLLNCGDIKTNPGPRSQAPKYPCTRCDKGVTARSKAISCDSCDRWTHVKCSNMISVAKYDEIVKNDEDFNYVCNTCIQDELPLGLIQDDQTSPEVNPNTSPLPEVNPNISPLLDANVSDSTSYSQIFQKKGLHLLHINIRSLRHKIGQLALLAQESKASIIAVTETWLDPSVTNREIAIDGYNTVRKDRSSHGGGVCLYIKTSLAYNTRPDLDNNLEATWIDLLLKKTKPILIGCIYRPPQQRDFFDPFEQLVSNLPTDSEIIILGDTNINLLNTNCTTARQFKNILRSNGLKQLITEPTRKTVHSSSLIDHIIVSQPSKICVNGVLPVGLSDHCAVFCTRKLVKVCTNRENIINVRSLRKYSREALNEAIQLHDWDNVLNCKDTNLAWNNFVKNFSAIIDKIAPVRKRKIKTRTQPWITPDIIEGIHQRDKLLRRFHRLRDNDSYAIFCAKRNEVQQLVKKAKKDYILEQTEANKRDSKKLWNTLKSIGYSNKNSQKEPMVLKIDDNICFDPVAIAEHVNHFFINIAQNIVQALPHVVDSFSAFSESTKTFYRKLGVRPGAYVLKEVSPSFINKHLKSLNPNKSTGLDNIGPRFLCDGADSLTSIITYIVNLSIKSKIVPDCVKTAKVTPIHKKNDKLEVGNYRPISILPALSKTLEKAIHAQIDEHCKRNNLYYQLQSGFRTNYSTSTCLTYLHDHIRTEIANGKYVGLVMLDVQKAFDSVNHDSLCEKVNLAGIEPHWFKSYLEERKQTVLVNDTFSSCQTIKTGVPQGSILGPWCYLLYCNDMPRCVKNCKIVLYADDTILITSNKDLAEVKRELSEDMSNCFHWLTNNGLAMHKGKTEALIISSKRKRHNTHNFTITFEDQTIRPSPVVKYLGLQINNNLSGDEIAQSIISKANGRLKFLYRHRELLNFKTRKTLSQALILSHLDYATGAWYAALSKKYKDALQVTQNKVVRFVLELGPREHIGQTELDRAGFLSVQDRATQLILHTMYDVYRGTAPDYLCNSFKKNRSRYVTRSNQNCFEIPRSKGCSEHNFSTIGAIFWNKLPLNTKIIQTKQAFKKAVKSFLRTQAHQREHSDTVSH